MSDNSGVPPPLIEAKTAQEALADEREYVLHAWAVQRDYNSPTIVGGEGSWFWDIDGKRYLDFGSQAMSNNAGHQHPKIVSTIAEQANQLCFAMASFGTLPRSQLAKKLAQIAPGHLKKSFFTTGGSEANENAIKMARYYTGKRKIISRWRSYHGATAAAMTASGDPRRWAMEPGVDGIVRAMDTYCYRCPFSLTYPDCGIHCVEHIADLIKMEGDSVAAVMIEPVVGSNGLLVPPDEYLPRLREICTEHNVLLIADEVMSGFGRTGQWFACDNWEVIPDIVTVAKGLTSASVPLGAVIVSEPIAEFFDDKALACGLTYFGHPLACAAALATINVYEEEGINRKWSGDGQLFARKVKRATRQAPLYR